MSRYIQTCFEIALTLHQAEEVTTALVIAESDYSYSSAISKIPERAVPSQTGINQLIWNWWDLMSKAEGVEPCEFMMPEHFNAVTFDDGMGVVVDSSKAECCAVAAFTQAILKTYGIDGPIPIRCAISGETLSPGNHYGQNMLVSSDFILTDLTNDALSIEKQAIEQRIKHFLIPVRKLYGGRCFDSQLLVTCGEGHTKQAVREAVAGSMGDGGHSMQLGQATKIGAYEHSILASHLQSVTIV
jgi:hypothetical protein